MEQAIQRVAMLVVSIAMLFFSNRAFGQEYTKSKYYFYTNTSDGKEEYTVRGVILADENLQPISMLMPVVTYCQRKKDEEFVFDSDGVYNTEGATFQVELSRGMYKFRSSQVGYHEIETEWINVDQDISIVFIMKKYESGGFHD